MKKTKYNFLPVYADKLLTEVFKEDIARLETAMVKTILDAIKTYPKPQVGFVRNRLKVIVKPTIILYSQPPISKKKLK
jgi:hypothetical protein